MKKNIVFIFMIIFICSVLQAEISSTEQLVRITGHLESIRSEYKFQRELSGGILIGAGVISSLFGMCFLLPSDIGLFTFGYREIDTIFGTVFLASGITYGVVGGITLAFPSEYETLPGAFFRMPELTEDEKRAKIAKGEVYLESLAQKAKNSRYLSAGLSIAGGIGLLVYAMMIDDSSSDYYYTSMSDQFLYEGISCIGLGLVVMMFKTKPETEFETYEKWKKNSDIAMERSSRPNIDLVLLKAGIGFSFRY